jgi:hypothetical protein
MPRDSRALFPAEVRTASKTEVPRRPMLSWASLRLSRAFPDGSWERLPAPNPPVLSMPGSARIRASGTPGPAEPPSRRSSRSLGSPEVFHQDPPSALDRRQ